MSVDPARIPLVCPRCYKTELSIRDVEEPPKAVVIELACSKCLDEDDSLPISPVYRDALGLAILGLPLKRNFPPLSPDDSCWL